jgi:mRNA (2'-O-methyladenosine-N6-)-methyltransferase
LAKPSEVYDIIERFCLGRKRIELFGTNNNIRNGWLTIGAQLTETKFMLPEYNKWFDTVAEIPADFRGGRHTGTTPGIEIVRPKEDTHQTQSQPQLQSQRSFADEEGKRSLAKSEAKS